MPTSWEANFHKVTTVTELPPGKPQVFRAAGATVVLRRADSDVSAIDGSCLAEGAAGSREDRVRRVLDCVAAGIGSASTEWEHLHARASLPVRVENDEVWVCIDACRP